MGLWKGKKGSSVFYKIWNSNNKEKQGVREYQPEVRNPQTNGQADQRMKMLAAQLVKGALRDIVSRSFQGIPYGAKSRLEFMKYALRAEIFPYLPKGWTDPVPGSYLVSRGTLAPIGCIYEQSEPAFMFNFQCGSEVESTTTEGDLAAQILEKNSQFQEGDQLTFIGCLMWDGFSIHFEWVYYSIILNPDSTRVLRDIPGYDRAPIKNMTKGSINYMAMAGDADNLCSAACIHSRQGADGLFLRSTTELTIPLEYNDNFESYFSAAAKSVARASYQTKTRSNATDWPVQESQEIAGTVDGTYTLSGFTGDMAVLNGLNVKVLVSETTGNLKAVYIIDVGSYGDALVAYNGQAAQYTVGGEVTYLRPDQVPDLATLPTIRWTAQAGRMAAPMAAPAVEEPAPAEKKTTKKK